MPESGLDHQKWMQDGKAKAPELRASAEEAARDMFSEGDIRDFLDILSRFSGFDAYNLMLIVQQYPKAKFLAGYNVWKRLLNNPAARILKPEWVGKGIDLVIPFIDAQENNEHRLVWFPARQFDISQTNVKYELPRPVYVVDNLHNELLVKSLCETISMEYHRSVFHKGADARMKAAGVPGEISESTVSIRDDMKPAAKLDWLIDCLCQLQGGENKVPAEYRELFRQSIKYALWKVWGLDSPPTFYAYKDMIRSVGESVQMEFLNEVVRTFRYLEESVAAAYSSLRRDLESESVLKELDDDILNIDMKPPNTPRF